MAGINRLVILGTVSLSILLSSSFLAPQQPQPAPAAPVPAQIVSARKAFISNGGQQPATFGDPYFSGGTDRPYNEFYAAMKDWGRFELVSAPADADIVLQFRVADRVSSPFVELQVTVLDPKTNIALWTFSENCRKIGRGKTRDAAFEKSLSTLSDDLKKFMAGTGPSGQK